jgi:hypothetical protein
MIRDFSLCQRLRSFFELVEFIGLVVLKCMHTINTRMSEVDLPRMRPLRWP